MENLPRRRALETNSIDYIVRGYGGQTIAIEMEPRNMKKFKQSKDLKFKEKISETSQALLHSYIIGLLDEMRFEENRDLSKALVDAVDEFHLEQETAFKDFIESYEPPKSSKITTASTDGFI
ncbi:hypothetical protein CC86DRAFT_397703 [Ophiobolus disseminans]|uniref:Uncharacterized protein n=1 Tax=Ophiobolus disseminans TaxID=1469910 RepID=A0A6A6ZKB3_9PLEO|nr:hypothetical protein CC86DRAFT_397703 [Ophiobolus disseminans]